jgi:hypothetical protein
MVFHYAKQFFPDLNIYFGIASNDRISIVNLCTQFEEQEDPTKKSILLVQVITNNVRHIWTCVKIFGDDSRTEDKFEESIRKINRKYCVTFQTCDCLRRSVTETGVILKAEYLDFVLITTFENAIEQKRQGNFPRYYTGWAAIGASVMRMLHPTERYFLEGLKNFQLHYAEYPEPPDLYDEFGKYNYLNDNVSPFVREAIWADQQRIQTPQESWKTTNYPSLAIDQMDILPFICKYLDCTFLIVELLDNGEGYVIVDAKGPEKHTDLKGETGYYILHRAFDGCYNALRMRVSEDETNDQIAAGLIQEQVNKFLGYEQNARWDSVSPRKFKHPS